MSLGISVTLSVSSPDILLLSSATVDKFFAPMISSGSGPTSLSGGRNEGYQGGAALNSEHPYVKESTLEKFWRRGGEETRRHVRAEGCCRACCR